ncbi:Rad60-SLD domain-containing protein, partial [Cephalotus follicularis]
DFMDDLEPLFDYRRVQPLNFFCLDDSDTSPAQSPKRRKISKPVVSFYLFNVDKDEEVKVIDVVNCDDDEDWLPPPPKVLTDVRNKLDENSTIKQLRLKKHELVSFAQSAKDILQAVEESIEKELVSSVETATEQPANPSCERAKIVISIQDKDELKLFRVFVDDKFERFFKMYADKTKLDLQRLVFCFDGDKISPTETPVGLGMDDNDIIEVHVKK